MNKKILLSVLILGLVFITACAVEEEVEEKIEEVSEGVDLFMQIKEGFDLLPVSPNMPNHIYKEIGEGAFVFLHFDKAVDQATQIWYTGVAYPGRFCSEDQAEMNEKYEEGFTHFHKKEVKGDNPTPEQGHGGNGGELGFWFKHVSVSTHEKPWGTVSPGLDLKFMPTPPPSCQELGFAGY